MRARKHYACALCGGRIPSGTIYQRDVVRDGPNKGRDPIRSVRSHLNCQTPWWQPDGLAPRLRKLGQLPGRTPTTAEVSPQEPFLKPVLAVSNETIGTFTWKLPTGLETRLGRCPSEVRKIAALTELEDALALILCAFVEAAGNQRRAQELSHRLGDIAALLT